MPPPPKRARSSVPLPPAAFSAALDVIIERDFFPDLPLLEQQLSWLRALDSGDAARISDARAGIASGLRRSDALVSATPASVVSDVASVAAARSRGLDALGLDSFLTSFRSVDDASFSANVRTRIANFRRRTWWLHSHTSGSAWRYMLTDGHASRAAPSAEALLLDDANVAGVIVPPTLLPGADPHGCVNTWPWRPKNALFFAPRLHVNDVGEHAVAVTTAQSLSARYSGLDLFVPSEPPPPQLHHKATRLPGRQLNAALCADSKDHSHVLSRQQRGVGGYDFMPTPMLFPGGSENTTILTWGEVVDVPTRMDSDAIAPALSLPPPVAHGASAPAIDFGASSFRVAPVPAREKLHDALLRSRASAHRASSDVRSVVLHAPARSVFAAAATPSVLFSGSVRAPARAPPFSQTPRCASVAASFMEGRLAPTAAAHALSLLPPRARAFAAAARDEARSRRL